MRMESVRSRFIGCAALALSLVAAAPAVDPSAAQVRAEVERIFRGSEFRKSAAQLLLDWLLDWLSRIASKLGGLREAAPFLFWFMLVGCIVLLLGILAHMVWTLRSIFWLPRFVADARLSGSRERLARSATYYGMARARSVEGDYTEAVRCLFLSLVYRLDESGDVLFPKARTNREYLSLFNEKPDLARDLRVFVDLLDENWYGRHETAGAAYEHCSELYDRISGKHEQSIQTI